MRLVYVTAGLPNSFDETFIVPEVLELERRGHRVKVVPVRPRRGVFHADARRLSAVAHHPLAATVMLGALREIGSSPRRCVRAARVVLRSRSVGILLKNLLVLPKALWLARRLRVERIDHVHAHWAGTSATVAMIASTAAAVPWSLTAHRWDISENNLLAAKVRAAHFVRAIDGQGLRELAPLMERARGRLRVIHMGVVTTGDSQRVRAVRAPGPFRLLLAARFVEVKGHRYALQAIAQLKRAGHDVVLDCIGHGPLEKSLRRYARDIDVDDRVRFRGIMDHERLQSELDAGRWDAAILPSIRRGAQREGIPVFLIEAMAAAIPVIATETGGISELLRDDAGLLVPERAPDALAESIRALSGDSELRCRLANNGWRRVREQYSVEQAVSDLLRELTIDSVDDAEQASIIP